jgi:alpha-L-rhamnosidase
MDVVIPPNTTATVSVPTSQPKKVTESGNRVRDAVGVKFLETEDGYAVLEVQSGRYEFSAPLEKKKRGGKAK